MAGHGRAAGAEVIESLAAFAQPAGPTIRAVYEGFRDRILADLTAALPVDMVLINMHGAMVAEGYLDCEGDLLGRIRALVGPDTVIGGELDLHCSITQAMTDAADALITFKEYPHIDGKERARELFTLCHAAQRGAVRPVMTVRDLRMINTWRTSTAPGADIVAAMQEAERRNDILSVSFAHGFPGATCPRPAPRSWSSAMTRRPPERRWPKISPSSSGGPARASTRRCRRCRRRSTAPWRRPRGEMDRWSWPMSPTTPAAARHRI